MRITLQIATLLTCLCALMGCSGNVESGALETARLLDYDFVMVQGAKPEK